MTKDVESLVIWLTGYGMTEKMSKMTPKCVEGAFRRMSSLRLYV